MPNPYGITATRDYLLAGNEITRLEAMILFATPDLTKIISDLRSQGKKVESRTVPLAKAIARVNAKATFLPPALLPVEDITVTEYWVVR